MISIKSMKNTKAIIAIVITVVLLIIVIFGVIWFKSGRTSSQSIYSTITSLEKVDEHVFVVAGINEVVSKTQKNKYHIPFSERKALIVLNYKVKIGIDEPVEINKSLNKKVKVVVPEFKIIGFDWAGKEKYKMYDNSGKILSFTTEEIDTAQMLVDAQSDAKKKRNCNRIQRYGTRISDRLLQKNIFRNRS